jgi:hypothetical protein
MQLWGELPSNGPCFYLIPTQWEMRACLDESAEVSGKPAANPRPK